MRVGPEDQQPGCVGRVGDGPEGPDARRPDRGTRVVETVVGPTGGRGGIDLEQPIECVGAHTHALVRGEPLESGGQLGCSTAASVCTPSRTSARRRCRAGGRWRPGCWRRRSSTSRSPASGNGGWRGGWPVAAVHEAPPRRSTRPPPRSSAPAGRSAGADRLAHDDQHEPAEADRQRYGEPLDGGLRRQPFGAAARPGRRRSARCAPRRRPASGRSPCGDDEHEHDRRRPSPGASPDTIVAGRHGKHAAALAVSP